MEAATLIPARSAALPRLLRAASDERLVARLRDGDVRAFEVIYDRYHLALLSFCRHMVGTREEAEDVLQQVFVSAHGQLLRDDRAVQLRPWLYAIARNRCLSVLRARRETVAIDDVAEPSADGLAVAAQVQQRQDLQDILHDLGRLPDDQRAALVLAELEDLSHDEIAVVLDVRRDKVKALVFQARETLMGFREARDADCADIREQLATLRGGALRRTALQRHLAICPGCTAFKDEVKRQRAVLGAVMPVVPALALKHQILGAAHAATVGTGAAAGAAGVSAAAGGSVSGGGAAVGGSAAVVGSSAASGGGIAAAVGSASIVAKVLAVTTIAASVGGGAVAIRHTGDDPPVRRAPVTAPAARSAPPAVRVPTTTSGGSAAGSGVTRRGGNAASGGGKGKPASGTSAGASGAARGRSPKTAPAGSSGHGRSSSSGSATNGHTKSKPAATGNGSRPKTPTGKPTVSKAEPMVPGAKRPTAIKPPGGTTPSTSRRPASTSAANPASESSRSAAGHRQPADPAAGDPTG